MLLKLVRDGNGGDQLLRLLVVLVVMSRVVSVGLVVVVVRVIRVELLLGVAIVVFVGVNREHSVVGRLRGAVGGGVHVGRRRGVRELGKLILLRERCHFVGIDEGDVLVLVLLWLSNSAKEVWSGIFQGINDLVEDALEFRREVDIDIDAQNRKFGEEWSVRVEEMLLLLLRRRRDVHFERVERVGLG